MKVQGKKLKEAEKGEIISFLVINNRNEQYIPMPLHKKEKELTKKLMRSG